MKLSRSKKIFIGIGCIALAGILIFCLWFFNGIYYDTPLEALDAERERPVLVGPYSSDELFSVKELIDIVYIEDAAEIIYISKADTFSVATCEYDKLRAKWTFDGIWSTENLQDDNDTFIFKKGSSLEHVGVMRGKTVWGMKLADNSILYINGEKTKVKKYNFYFKEQNQGVEFWYIENILDENYTVEVR